MRWQGEGGREGGYLEMNDVGREEGGKPEITEGGSSEGNLIWPREGWRKP